MNTNTNLFVCKTHWLDEEEMVDYILCNGPTYKDCIDEVFFEYGEENILSIELIPVSSGPVEISQSVAEMFISGFADRPIGFED